MGIWETDQEMAIDAFVERLNGPTPLYVSDFFADGDDDGIPRISPDSNPPAPEYRYFDDEEYDPHSYAAREVAEQFGALAFAVTKQTDREVVVV